MDCWDWGFGNPHPHRSCLLFGIGNLLGEVPLCRATHCYDSIDSHWAAGCVDNLWVYQELVPCPDWLAGVQVVFWEGDHHDWTGEVDQAGQVAAVSDPDGLGFGSLLHCLAPLVGHLAVRGVEVWEEGILSHSNFRSCRNPYLPPGPSLPSSGIQVLPIARFRIRESFRHPPESWHPASSHLLLADRPTVVSLQMQRWRKI